MHKSKQEKEVQKLEDADILQIIGSRIGIDDVQTADGNNADETPDASDPETSEQRHGNRSESVKMRHSALAGLRRKTNIVSPDQFDWANRLIPSFQLGMDVALSQLANKELRDLLFHDFFYIEIINFSPDLLTKVQNEHETFTLKVYAPMAFAHFRKLFNVRDDAMRSSICERNLSMVANAGASGSIFYVSPDRQFVLKTVTKKEAKFLQELLPEYYMNIHQNPSTFLPRFYGLYVVKRYTWVMRLVIMNNIIRVDTVEQKFDLKGSRYHRLYHAEGNAGTVGTHVPTMKDLDFLEAYPNGLLLSEDVYDIVSKTLQRDVVVLESFGIMDYSLLLAIRPDTGLMAEASAVAAGQRPSASTVVDAAEDQSFCQVHKRRSCHAPTCFGRRISKKLAEIILPCGGIPAASPKGEPLVIYMGIIDILQAYGFRKIMEHFLKSICIHADTADISVQSPDFYALRFNNFITHSVFGQMPATIDKKSRAAHPDPAAAPTDPPRCRTASPDPSADPPMRRTSIFPEITIATGAPANSANITTLYAEHEAAAAGSPSTSPQTPKENDESPTAAATPEQPHSSANTPNGDPPPDNTLPIPITGLTISTTHTRRGEMRALRLPAVSSKVRRMSFPGT